MFYVSSSKGLVKFDPARLFLTVLKPPGRNEIFTILRFIHSSAVLTGFYFLFTVSCAAVLKIRSDKSSFSPQLCLNIYSE